MRVPLRRLLESCTLTGALAAWSTSALAQPATTEFTTPTGPTTTAGAAHVTPATVWFRSSEGCPTGEQFIARVATQQRPVRLARAGDRVDFVVTLSKSSETATGRLERQTSSGTIAISDIRDPNCATVGEALALSLGLSLAPEQPASPRREGPTNVASTPTAAVQTPAPAPSSASARGEKPSQLHASKKPVSSSNNAAPPEVAAAAASQPSARALTPWALGVLGEGAFGLNPHAIWGGYVFLERRGDESSPWLARAGVAVHHGSEPDARGSVEQWLISSRMSGCPLSWHTRSWYFAPCVELDLGVITAGGGSATGKQATAFWGTVGAAARLGLRLNAVELQAQAAARATINPYEVRRNGQLQFESRALSPWFGFGAAVPF